jgi:hypothetical protein
MREPIRSRTLQVNKDWRIIADAVCFTLQKRSERKKGKLKGSEMWTNWGYHSRLEDVFSSLCEHVIRENWGDMPAIIQEVHAIRDIITQFKTL